MADEEQGRCLIASYPKSGNTWLRFIVFHLAYRRGPKSSEELDALVNSDHDGVIANGLPAFRKTHALPSAITPLLTPTTRAIHVVRHPLDVMRSAMNYAILTGEAPDDDGASLEAWRVAWLDAYARFGGHPLWEGRPFFCGTWARNTTEWRALDCIPVLRLSYEAMLESPAQAISTIADFLGVDLTQADLDFCVKSTTFSALRKFEEHEIELARRLGHSLGRFSKPARMRAAQKGVRFFDQGAPGSYRNALPFDLAASAWANMLPTAERVGYRFPAA